jgi:3'-5' exonuclease
VVGATHIGQRTARELIESFVNKIAQVSPQMVTYNGGSFDPPILRYRATVHEVFAPGMHNRAYYHRYTATCFRR